MDADSLLTEIGLEVDRTGAGIKLVTPSSRTVVGRARDDEELAELVARHALSPLWALDVADAHITVGPDPADAAIASRVRVTDSTGDSIVLQTASVSGSAGKRVTAVAVESAEPPRLGRWYRPRP